MSFYYRTEGFVFKKEDWLEADRVFSVFTRDLGRVEIFAKAIRKIASKLKGGIEIFSLSDIEFIQGRNKKTLTDAVYLEKFRGIDSSPEKMKVSYGITTVLDNFIKGEQKDENIFNLLNEVFSKLNNYQLINKNYSLMYYYFFWNLVSLLGYGPEFLKCAACLKKLNPYSLYFSNKEGGIICRSCSFSRKDGLKINSDVVKILRLILNKDWDILSRLKIETNSQNLLKEVSGSYYLYLNNLSYDNHLKDTT